MSAAFPFLCLATNGVLSFGLKAASVVGYKAMVLLCVLCISVGFAVCSFVTDVGLFIGVYSTLVGIPTGLVYMLPISIFILFN